MLPGIDAQIEALRAVWPHFQLVAREGDVAMCEGQVRPLLRTYRIRVVYRVPMFIEILDPRRLQPRVSILAPALRFLASVSTLFEWRRLPNSARLHRQVAERKEQLGRWAPNLPVDYEVEL